VISDNSEFRKKIRAPKANYYLCDFHVHSPASSDIRTGKRFNALSAEEQALISEIPSNLTSKPVEYEREALKCFPVERYYQLLLARKTSLATQQGIEETENYAVVAITDHNVARYSSLLSQYAWGKRNADKLIVLPGMELDVEFSIGDTKACVHILLIYSPCTSDSDIRQSVINALSGKNWDYGNTVTTQSLPEFILRLREYMDYPAICIAAHVASGKGVQKEACDAIKLTMSNLQAAIARSEGELAIGCGTDIKDIENRLKALKQKYQDVDDIHLEVLQLIGTCGFDALQVKGKEDEVHYRRLHRFDSRFGRSVPLIASDAHAINEIFTVDEMVPFLKLKTISSSVAANEIFTNIRDCALRYGETRFSCCHPGKVIKWIAGIEITRDAANASAFWPFGEGNSFVLPFTRNLNCLIGGRGSGKSAIIDAISFLVAPDRFNTINKKQTNSENDSIRRAKSTIGGCVVKLCWQILGSDTAIPKGSVFVSRYYSVDGSHPAPSYQDIKNNELLPSVVPETDVQLFAIHQIEETADPSKLRKLFDEICGTEIEIIQLHIAEVVKTMHEQVDDIVILASEINNITNDGTALREYAKRKIQYDEVNKPEFKSLFENIDNASQADRLLEKVKEAWDELKLSISPLKQNEKIEEFFERIEKATSQDILDKNEYLKVLNRLIAIGSNDKSELLLKETLIERVHAVHEAMCNVEEKIGEIDDDIKEKHREARDVLLGEGLPVGAKDRGAKKTAYDEACDQLTLYRDLNTQFDELVGNRNLLRADLIDLCSKRTTIRKRTASSITTQLDQDLDGEVLKIIANAQPDLDKSLFVSWLSKNLAKAFPRFRDERIAAMVETGVTPEILSNVLFSKESSKVIINQRDKAAAGKITAEDAIEIVKECAAVKRIEPEVRPDEVGEDFFDSLPEEIQKGLVVFPISTGQLNLKQVLQLDEIVYDDIPIILLNDRPSEANSKARPIDELSPGQRCSAILPILLLNGDMPLIIDQPEDNLDNRLVRQVIVNILSSIKLRRQVIVATHNPNIPVLGDSEQVIVLRAVEEKECRVDATGDLDDPQVVKFITEIMEGGREAFQYRQSIYQSHWNCAVETDMT
jgi:DNA repair ATPase RecN